MPLSRRYTPEKPPSETSIFGMDFSAIIPPSVGIISGALDILHNTVPATEASSEWTVGAVTVRGRVLYASLGGGVNGTDYQLVWTAQDTQGNVWPRVGLCLVAETS
jgi:hypothetical protein